MLTPPEELGQRAQASVVIVTPDHVVKVMDLGVARIQEASLRLSKTGEFLGSLPYAAPEQFLGGNVDPRTDQFGFCSKESVPGRPYCAEHCAQAYATWATDGAASAA